MTKTEIVESMLEMLNSPEKWTKNSLRNHNGAHCVMGALNEIVMGYYEYPWMSTGHARAAGHERGNKYADIVQTMAEVALDKGFPRYPDEPIHTVVRFNNNPKTEYEDVRMLLKETLERVSD